MTDPHEEPVDYLAEHLREAIAVDSDIHELGIQVQVTAGRVRLAGSVPTAEQRQAIDHLVRRLAPDLELLDEIEVTSHVEPAPTDVEDLG